MKSTASKPEKPSPDFPLTPHPAGKWCKKIKGKLHYFGRWDDPVGALAEYQAILAGTPQVKDTPRKKKVRKPNRAFPLTPHPTGRWCKRIRGKLHYFGRVEDRDAALDRYLREKDDLHAGRKPRGSDGGELTVLVLVNKFLHAKRMAVDAGELTARSWGDYYATCNRVAEALGKNRLVTDLDAADFERLKAGWAKSWGPHAVANEVQRTRVLFKYGYDSGLLDRPMRYGPTFKRPSKKVMRLNRARLGERMFEPEDLRKIIAAADQPLKAMILLGINCGYGNADVGSLPLSALDLEAGWATFPRPKTGIMRRAKLWPETVAAIRDTLASRPMPKTPDAEPLVFVTQRGKAWHRDTRLDKLTTDKPLPPVCSPVSAETTKLLKRLGLKRPGISFYTLRHVFETVGGAARDQVAVDSIMGHADQSMSAAYRERVEDDRLEYIATHVRNWLYGEAAPVLKIAEVGREEAAKSNGRMADDGA